jgi:hypothetical protein
LALNVDRTTDILNECSLRIESEIIISLLLAESSLTIACLNMQVVDPSPIDSTCSGLTPLGAALKNDHDQVVNLLTGAGAQ